MVSSGFTHIVACVSVSSLLRLCNIPLSIHTIHLVVHVWVASTSWLLWVVLLWTQACKYLTETVLLILLKPRTGIDGSYGSSAFHFLRSLRPVFYSSCAVLESHQQDTRVPVPPHPQQRLFFSLLPFPSSFFPPSSSLLPFLPSFPSFLIVAILTGVRWYITVVFYFSCD